MKPEVKEAWVKALRSGEYQQTTGRLRKYQGFSCLGVLCDIYNKQEQPLSVEERNWCYHMDICCYTYDGFNSTIPSCVQEWAGLDSNNPGYFDEHRGWRELADINDQGKDFDYIADLIEVHF
jgi:hypothetical protein